MNHRHRETLAHGSMEDEEARARSALHGLHHTCLHLDRHHLDPCRVYGRSAAWLRTPLTASDRVVVSARSRSLPTLAFTVIDAPFPGVMSWKASGGRVRCAPGVFFCLMLRFLPSPSRVLLTLLIAMIVHGNPSGCGRLPIVGTRAGGRLLLRLRGALYKHTLLGAPRYPS